MKRPLLALALCFGMLAAWAPGASAENRNTSLVTSGTTAQPANYAGASENGARAFFTTTESLLGTDTDGGQVDLYERSSGATYHLSTLNSGQAAAGNTGASFGGASADGSKVFFTTTEKLDPAADQDTAADVYQRSAGVTTLLSGGANGGANVTYRGASADGGRVFFETSEKLLPGVDTDSATDVYMVSGGTFTVLSGGTGPQNATFKGATPDGSKVFFTTTEGLAGFADTNGTEDIYQGSVGSSPTLVSGAVPGAGIPVPKFEAVSADGTRVTFSTRETFGSSADGDGLTDVYQRVNGGTPTWVSQGANGNEPAAFAGASSDGTKVFFTSIENFPGDSDQGAQDVFEWSNGTVGLVSQGGSNDPAFYGGASADGSRVFFTTAEKLDSAPDDSGGVDIYERSGSATKLVSGGTANTPAVFKGVSADGARVFFETDEQLLLGIDTDSATDVYLRSYGGLTLVSSGANGATAASFERASADGGVAFFSTTSSLGGLGDNDGGLLDVYQSKVNAQCFDGIDNDGDGRIDVGQDPGCTSTNDDSESPDPPQCSDGLDNDGDGKTDFPGDLGCGSGADDSESPDPVVPPATNPGGGSGSSGGSAGGGSGGGNTGSGTKPPAQKGRVINGTKGNDVIKGTAGDDVINCGAGNDRVNGGGGNDVIKCGAGKDKVSGGAGNDRIDGGKGDDSLSGDGGNDSLAGGAGNDKLSGGAGTDRLGGGAGRDDIRGGAGRDKLDGGPGRDKQRQ